jgi:autotransporter-associated beta strand protein
VAGGSLYVSPQNDNSGTAKIILNNTPFTNNTATLNTNGTMALGGGALLEYVNVDINGNTTSPSGTNATISGNEVKENDSVSASNYVAGGGLAIHAATGGTNINIQNIDISKNEITGNASTYGYRGGGVYLWNDDSPSAYFSVNIDNVDFDTNTISAAGEVLGGALMIEEVASSGENQKTIKNSSFTNNGVTVTTTATDKNALGGALYVHGQEITIEDTDFSGNYAKIENGSSSGSAQGGAIYTTNNITIKATSQDVTFSSNYAGKGNDVGYDETTKNAIFYGGGDAGTITFDAATDKTITDNDGIGGAKASVTKTGAGTLELGGNYTYGGNTTINGGDVEITGKLGYTSTVNSYGQDITITSGSLTFNQDFEQTLNGKISGEGNLIKDGSGTLIITAENTGDGLLLTGDNSSFNVTEGTAVLRKGTSTTGFTAKTVTVGNGATLYVGDSATNTALLTATNLTVNGLEESKGLLRIYAAASSGIANSTAVTVDGGTIKVFNNGDSFDLTNSYTTTINTNGATFDIDDKINYTIGTITGTGKLTKAGAGTLTLTTDIHLLL